jgi:ATP-dependent Clp protease ATP-binding subunit ClpA
MFERFTDRARRVVVLAQEEARMLDHNYIGPEHILLGLIHEGQGVAARALTGLGVSLEAVRQQIEEVTGRGQAAPSGHIPFTPRAKRVLELSLREALQLGHNYIGTEHILLGILREGENVGAQVLVRMGTDLNRVRQEVVRLVGPGEEGEGAPASGPEPRIARAASRDFLLAEVRNALAGINARLTAIERHLGLEAALRDPGDHPGGRPDVSGERPDATGERPDVSGERPDAPGHGEPPGDQPDEPPGDVSATGE